MRRLAALGALVAVGSCSEQGQLHTCQPVPFVAAGPASDPDGRPLGGVTAIVRAADDNLAACMRSAAFTLAPSGASVEQLALEKLVRRLYATMPGEALKCEAASLQPILTDYNRVHVTDEGLLHRRASEAASDILWDVWMAGQEAQHRRSMFGDPHPCPSPHRTAEPRRDRDDRRRAGRPDPGVWDEAKARQRPLPAGMLVQLAA